MLHHNNATSKNNCLNLKPFAGIWIVANVKIKIAAVEYPPPPSQSPLENKIMQGTYSQKKSCSGNEH